MTSPQTSRRPGHPAAHGTPYRIEPAAVEDREAILEVMRPWNMHHVPSPEMEELDLDCFFVARDPEGRVVGASGFKVLSQSLAKTTLLAVLPELAGSGLGARLQDRRLRAMHRLGIRTVVTNADRPATIEWYQRRFGYRVVGTLPKVAPFGDPEIPAWTTLELDLVAYAGKWEARSTLVPAPDADPHPLTPYPPVLINACLTGMVPTREQSALVPLTPEEIVTDAVRCFDAGARVLHLHARDEAGRPTWRGEVYEKILGGIRRERPEAILCASTSGRNWPELERRAEVLHLEGPARPDFASLTLGSLNFRSGPSVNAMETIQSLAAIMAEQGVRPELEIFDLGMIGYARYLDRKGLLPERKVFNLLLGSLGTAPATIGTLAQMVAALPRGSVWSAAGIGVFQLPMNLAALVAGGGVRVGLEDNLFYDFGRQQPASNLELVNRVTRLAEELQRPVATPKQARVMTGLDEDV